MTPTTIYGKAKAEGLSSAGSGRCEHPRSCAYTCRISRFTLHDSKMNSRNLFIALATVMVLTKTPSTFAQNINGKNLYTQRCAVCHGADIKGTGPLAQKSTPPTPDLTTNAFRKRLKEYPGVIVSSVILRPNGDLIPRTLRENNVKLAAHTWTVQDFRDLNNYMSSVITKIR